jgi:hypothetical protein
MASAKESSMGIVLRPRTLALASVVCSTLLIATCLGKAQQRTEAKPSGAEETLRRFLQTFDDDKTTQYVAAFRDLNADGRPEAVVYLIGRKWCGTGGCTTLVLTPDGDFWRMVARITITRTPIRVLEETSKGWHSIGVWVQGGGIQPGYEAELPFDGKTYPGNPSVPPARQLKQKPSGETVIPSSPEAKPLYESR